MKIIPYKLCPSALSSYFIEQFNQPRRLKTQTVLSYNQCNSIAQIITIFYWCWCKLSNIRTGEKFCVLMYVFVLHREKIILGRFSDSQLDVGWFIPTRVLTWLRWLEAWPELLPWSKFKWCPPNLDWGLDGVAHNGSHHLPPHQIHLRDWTGGALCKK